MAKLIKHVMSGCSDIRFIPVELIDRYAVVFGRVRLLALGKFIRGYETPGTLKVSTIGEGSSYNLTITYNYSRFDDAALLSVRALASLKLIAVFKDPVGRLRAAGSKSYPLTLSVDESDGVVTVTLTGKTCEPNPYIPLSESFF